MNLYLFGKDNCLKSSDITLMLAILGLYLIANMCETLMYSISSFCSAFIESLRFEKNSKIILRYFVGESHSEDNEFQSTQVEGLFIICYCYFLY